MKETCKDPVTGTICAYNMIGVHYFLGDSTKAWEMLDKEIERMKAYSDFNAYALDNLLEKHYNAYRKFLRESTAKAYILDVMDSVYMTENVSDKENGLELLHLLVEDQWVRRMSSLYDKFDRERTHPLPSDMDSMQAIQASLNHCTEVFNFYKKRDKVFSEAEVGRIYYWQRLMFFHEFNLERRDFYHELVVSAVNSGVLEADDQADFEAGTEYTKLGSADFFKRKAELEARYKKKYSLPDDYRIRLF